MKIYVALVEFVESDTTTLYVGTDIEIAKKRVEEIKCEYAIIEVWENGEQVDTIFVDYNN